MEPGPTVEAPRRKFPRHLESLLEPGSEYSEYGDYLFALYGMDADGYLAEGSMREHMERLPEVNKRPY